MRRALVVAGAAVLVWLLAWAVTHWAPATWLAVIAFAWVVAVGASLDMLWHREWRSFEARTFLTLFGCIALLLSHSLLARVFGLELPRVIPVGLTAWITVALAAAWRTLRRARSEFRNRRHDDPVPQSPKEQP